MISVIISTYDRANMLRDTLECFCEQKIHFAWELTVVNNACGDHTNAVLQQMGHRLPIRTLHEPVRGKSRAVNRALSQIQGALVVFTDDDVRPGPNWLSEYQRAEADYPDATVFCGPIVPLFPDETPLWLRSHAYTVAAFGSFNPPVAEGYLPPPWLPFGSNFAVKRQALAGMRMREDLGPSEGADLMSEDTEFLRRLRLKSESFIFVPSAGLGHVVRQEQLNNSWFFERAFRLGRSYIIDTGTVDSSANVNVSGSGDVARLETGVLLNYFYGQMYQLRLSGRGGSVGVLADAIQALPWLGEPDLLSRTAAQWLSDDRVNSLSSTKTPSR